MKQHGAIRVGYLENDPGFSAVNPQSGKLMGVVNDYIEYASNCFEQPLEFNLVGLYSQEALIQAVRADKIDMIFHVNQNPYYAEENGFTRHCNCTTFLSLIYLLIYNFLYTFNFYWLCQMSIQFKYISISITASK